MRIIGGIARGISLVSPPAKKRTIRPTSDRSREALFSILGEKVAKASVMDLYAGTGALGLEALSRGANSCVFVDSDPIAIQIVKSNIAKLFKQFSVEDDAPEVYVLKHDLRRGVNFNKRFPSTLTNSLDLIFLDPPYDKGLAERTLTAISIAELITDNGQIIVEERTHCRLPETIGDLALADQRTYGDTGFWLYSRRS